jgi:tRNA uridine 5-carbamoylmethylation protein Kti12
METPNPRNKWDRPLFILKKEDKIPFEDVKAALGEKAESVNRNAATETVRMKKSSQSCIYYLR